MIFSYMNVATCAAVLVLTALTSALREVLGGDYNVSHSF